ILRGPLRFRAEGPAAGGFQVQAGAFSQEEPAREKADRLAADLETTGIVAFSADRGVYRVLLGGFADPAGAEARAGKGRAAGEEGLVVEGRMSPSPGSAVLSVIVEDGAMRRIASPAAIYPADADSRILYEGKPYRGRLEILVNPRGLVTVV